MDRRDFIKQSLLAAGGLMASQVLGAENPVTNGTPKRISDIDYVTLNNGVRMPILGYGTLRLSESSCADCVAKAIETGW